MRGLFTLYNQKLAGYLMINGFPLMKIVQDRRTGRDDYLFPDTELLRDFIDRWQIEKLKTKTEQHDNNLTEETKLEKVLYNS